jgi:hypothetical protein
LDPDGAAPAVLIIGLADAQVIKILALAGGNVIEGEIDPVVRLRNEPMQ